MKLAPRAPGVVSPPAPPTPTASPHDADRWVSDEQGAFHSGLRRLALPTPGSATTLQLCSPPPPVVAGRVLLPTRAAHVTHHRPTRRLRRTLRGLTIPLALLGALGFLGYTAANQSVSALQAAWSSTDTATQVDTAQAQARYNLEDGLIPGPFAQMPSTWQALKQHLRPAAPAGPPPP